MFRLKQNVAQIITREHGDVVRIDKVLMLSPGRDFNPPTMRLALNPERLYDALTGQELGSHDTFVTTRVVKVEL